MADNTQVAGGTGDVIRDRDRAGIKTQIVGLDINVGGTESLLGSGNPLPIQAPRPQTDTPTRLTASTSSVQALAANPSRLGFTIETDPGSSVLYVTLGSVAATTANRTVTLQPGDYWEGPFQWAGAVQAIWSGTSGGASIHELTS